MIILIKILKLILALSIIVGFHEFGHFLFAKLFGARVDKFYLFFDIGKARLFSTRHNRFFRKLFPKAGEWETDYGIGWLPLGGYCKIAGMIDESMDKSIIGTEPQHWELRSKKPWQRLLVMAGGVLFNFLLAILLFVHILAVWGDNHLDNSATTLYAEEGMVAYDMGFRSGDRILSLDGKPIRWFDDIQAYIARHDVGRVSVLRDGETIDIYMDGSRTGDLLRGRVFMPDFPFVLDLPAEDQSGPNSALLCPGDQILSLDGQPIRYFREGKAYLSAHPDTLVTADILRSGKTVRETLRVDAEGHIGVLVSDQIALESLPGYTHLDYSYWASYPAGLRKAWETVSGYVLDLKLIFTPSTKAYQSVGSVGTMATMMPVTWDWEYYLTIVALLSVMLGVMNLLPIPALDGGHIVFVLFEMISGRKPSDRFMMVAQMVGMILLILLMVIAFGNDFIHLTR